MAQQTSAGKRGFTFLELLLVMALLSILVTLTLPVGLQFFRSQILGEAVEDTLFALRRAQASATLQENDRAFGMKFLGNSYVIFQGDSYATRIAAEDEIYDFSGGVTIEGIVQDAVSGWYDTDWKYRVRLSVRAAQVGSNLTDFPVYVDLADLPAGFWGHVKGSGGDIVVTDADGTSKLDRELVRINKSGNTGELHFKAPAISSVTDTDFYIYYGNSSASQSNDPGLWNDYEAVWHMELNPAALPTTYGLGVLTMPAMDGANGGYAVFYGVTPINESISMAIDEDELLDAERNHTTEQVGYWMFATSSSMSIRNSGGSIIGEAGKRSGVGTGWTTVNLENTYTSPVVVATYQLANASDPVAVVRIQNVGTNSFDMRIQNPGDLTPPTAGGVYYTVVESGTHTLPGGVALEAGTVLSNGTNENGNWSSAQMEQIIPGNSYTNPVVLGQVMTFNDPDFSTFWTSNGTQANPPTAASMYVGKQVGEDPDITRNDETLGYFIIEESGGFTGGIEWTAALGADTVYGVDDAPPYQYYIGGSGAEEYFLDSTSNGNHLGGRGLFTTGVAGALGNAAVLNGATGTYLPINSLFYSGTNALTQLTASLWLRTSSSARAGILDFDRSDHWEVGLNFHNAGGQAGRISFDTANSANGIRDLNSGSTVNDNSWHQAVVEFNDAAGTDKIIYLDGSVSVALDQHTAPLGTGVVRYGFVGDGSEANAYDGPTNNLPFNGIVDEIRIRHTALGPNWVDAEYTNQYTPSTFYSIGGEEVLAAVDEIVFAKQTGIPSTTGSLTVTSVLGDKRTIHINSRGKIELQ